MKLYWWWKWKWFVWFEQKKQKLCYHCCQNLVKYNNITVLEISIVLLSSRHRKQFSGSLKGTYFDTFLNVWYLVYFKQKHGLETHIKSISIALFLPRMHVLTCFLPTRQCWCTWVMDFGIKRNSSWRVGRCVFSWMWATAPADQYHLSSDSPPALAFYAGARGHWDTGRFYFCLCSLDDFLGWRGWGCSSAFTFWEDGERG